jgi:hypothetical protein
VFKSPSVAVCKQRKLIVSDILLWETGLFRPVVTSKSEVLKEVCTEAVKDKPGILKVADKSEDLLMLIQNLPRMCFTGRKMLCTFILNRMKELKRASGWTHLLPVVRNLLSD